ncbi:hypothetical protein ACFPFV_02120 [Salinicoccus siamensis]|uniref:Uncharacterized protein n=1 Tax=Salinicoccus siamensis TaxID=381830 RepID=A0ABV5Z4L6_9STAP
MEFILISTTSKHDSDILRLPSRNVLDQTSENFLISSKKKLMEFISQSSEHSVFLADCEKKQGLSIYDELVQENLKVLDYKPNDLTMEAADLTILNYVDQEISGKSVGVYGTGNIAFKLALRLSERNANIYLYGRNEKKIKVCVDALKQISFDETLIHYGTPNSKLDVLVSLVSSDEVITEDFIQTLNPKSLCLDGGIGNFSKSFIESALKQGHDVRRLDVRQSQEIMDGYINSRINSQFDSIIGRAEIESVSVVAGGIMGREGELIVDSISSPSKVIGVANGIGGVKGESHLNDEEKRKIKKIQSYIEQDCQKNT